MGASNSPRSTSDRKQKATFPMLLHSMLTRAPIEGFDHVVSWTSCGTMFTIHDRNRFIGEIMPKFFKSQSNFRSFARYMVICCLLRSVQWCTFSQPLTLLVLFRSSTRQLNLYKFQSISDSTLHRFCQRPTYFHPRFHRDKPEECVVGVKRPSQARHHQSKGGREFSDKTVGSQACLPKVGMPFELPDRLQCLPQIQNNDSLFRKELHEEEDILFLAPCYVEDDITDEIIYTFCGRC